MKKFFSKLGKLGKYIGPGIITGASDDDPSGIATYSMAGASFGLGFLWVAFLTMPLMIAAQELCGRIGMVGGGGLVKLLKSHYSKKVLYFCIFLLLVANTVNIGADLGAMADSLHMLIPQVSFIWLAVGATIVTLALEIFLSYDTYSKYLKFLTFFLFFYIAVAFFIHIDWRDVAINTFIPSGAYNKDFFLMLTAILGTTISPYLFFWQASQEVEEEIAAGRKTLKMRKGATKDEISNMRWDTSVGMVFSNIVMYFIIIVAAMTFAKNGIHQIDTAQQAAQMLEPLAGHWATWVFAAGIIGTGLLAIPILAGSAAFAFSEMFNLKRGLNLKYYQAKGFYGIIILSLLVGLIINFVGISPVKMLFYSAVLNGSIAPILLIFVFLTGNNEKIMGKWTSGKYSNVGVWLTILLLLFSALSIFFGFFF
jgi:NRAMP (natural resistance-associated macrophage protein)-like metal ion transporter